MDDALGGAGGGGSNTLPPADQNQPPVPSDADQNLMNDMTADVQDKMLDDLRDKIKIYPDIDHAGLEPALMMVQTPEVHMGKGVVSQG